MLDIIERDLFKQHMPSMTYIRLDGGTEANKRHAIVQTFNSDPSIDCLLLTTHVGGLGLTLTGADTVIFVEHDWNPMKDVQAMDRAHRIGQKKVVNVYRLITKGTVEEKIMGCVPLPALARAIRGSCAGSQNATVQIEYREFRRHPTKLWFVIHGYRFRSGSVQADHGRRGSPGRRETEGKEGWQRST